MIFTRGTVKLQWRYTVLFEDNGHDILASTQRQSGSKTGPGCFDTGNGIGSNYKQDDAGKGEVLVLFVAKVWM